MHVYVRGILMILAIVCFVLCAVPVLPPFEKADRLSLVAAGLAFWVIATLVG
jgi:hypothetical protein